MIAATAEPACSLVGKPNRTGRAQDAQGRLGDDAELALRADHQPEQVVAGRIQGVAADVHDRAVEQHHADAQNVVGGDAVFQAMGAAGVHRDIAADGAGELRRRVGGVEEAAVANGIADGEIGDAGFDAGGAVREVDFEDAGHLADADDDRILLRNRSTG